MSLVKNEKDLKMNDWIPEVERIKMFEKGEGYCAFSFGLKTLRLIRKDFPIRAVLRLHVPLCWSIFGDLTP